MAKRANRFTCQEETAVGCSKRPWWIILAALVALTVGATSANRGWAQDQTKPVVSIASVIQAQSAATTALPIQILPSNLIPRQAFLRIRGLPPTVALSDGHSIAVGAWAVPLAAVPRLRMEVPIGSEGKSEITILLVSVDGAILNEAKSTLVVVPSKQVSAPLPASVPQASALRIQPEAPPVPLAPGPLPKGPQLAPGDRDRALKMLQRGQRADCGQGFLGRPAFLQARCRDRNARRCAGAREDLRPRRACPDRRRRFAAKSGDGANMVREGARAGLG